MREIKKKKIENISVSGQEGRHQILVSLIHVPETVEAERERVELLAVRGREVFKAAFEELERRLYLLGDGDGLTRLETGKTFTTAFNSACSSASLPDSYIYILYNDDDNTQEKVIIDIIYDMRESIIFPNLTLSDNTYIFKYVYKYINLYGVKE